MTGPLDGLKVIELGGIGPAPMATMLLADLGADVVRIDRPGSQVAGGAFDPSMSLLNRGKQALRLDLKSPADVETVQSLIASADVLVEGFRPGVAERLGFGPADCECRNPRLVYGRISGWGSGGPLSQVAGHDINYIALSGALAAIGPRGGKPAIPLNLLGDFGGGSLYLAFGIMAALHERQGSGRGQVVDAAMIDGVASLMTTFFAQRASGAFHLERESNLVDGGTPFYDVYRTADDQWVSVGALEHPFFAILVDALGLDAAWIDRQWDKAGWPAMRDAFATRFAERTRDEWTAALGHLDACVAPVLTLDDSVNHPHHVARNTYTRDGSGVVQPAPAPRFLRTPAGPVRPVATSGTDPSDVLARWR